MNREEKLLDTETQLTKMVETVIDKVKPTECNLHSQLIKEFQLSIADLRCEIGTLRLNEEERAQKIDNIAKMVDDMNKRLFVSNGEICFAEEQRNIKGSLNRHLDNHSNIQVSGKLVVSIVASILLGLSSLAFNVIKTDTQTRITKEQAKEILIQVIKERLQ